MLAFPLVLAAGSLIGGITYAFRLTVTDNTDPASTAFAEVSFTTNAPPSSGTFTATPPWGYVLTTSFTLTDDNWVDDADDYPLRYSFYYRFPLDTTRQAYTLGYNSLYSSLSGVTLPQVSGMKGNDVSGSGSDTCSNESGGHDRVSQLVVMLTLRI